MQFTALVDFWSPETNSQYCAGLTYLASADPAARTLLDLLAQWVTDGKIQLAAATAAELIGRG